MTLEALRLRAQELAYEIEQLPALDRFEALNIVRNTLHGVSPNASEPVDLVQWVPHDQVVANSYNPNSVAKMEMTLLYRSISADGYTQPVVAIFDEALGKYVIIDGFHRFYVMGNSPDILARTHGYLPVVVLKKTINERMAATVRHNRARGKHSVDGMANMVFQMLDQGMADGDICRELGMEVEELVRLKHITGFSKLFKDTEYNRAWVTRNQVRVRMAREGKAFGDKPTTAPLPQLQPRDWPAKRASATQRVPPGPLESFAHVGDFYIVTIGEPPVAYKTHYEGLGSMLQRAWDYHIHVVLEVLPNPMDGEPGFIDKVLFVEALADG